jgi:hypothetical protein
VWRNFFEERRNAQEIEKSGHSFERKDLSRMERADPKTRNERKGKGGNRSHKTIYNQKSIRIQENLREKNHQKKNEGKNS